MRSSTRRRVAVVRRVGLLVIASSIVAACSGNPGTPAAASPSTAAAAPESAMDPNQAVCSVAAYLTVLVDYDRVIVSSSGFATTPGMVGTALQYLRQTRARLARLQEHYPDYARQLDASLDRYEQLLEQRASHPEAIDDATGLGAEIGSAAAGLKAVADGASRLVEECPGG